MIRVLLSDDHTMFREGVRGILETESDIEVVGESGRGDETLQLCRSLKPDVILLDLDMPGFDGMDVARHIIDEKLNIKIIILTMYVNNDYAVRLLQIGAMGYVPKYSSGKILPQVIRTVMNGSVYVPDDMKDALVQHAFGARKNETHVLSDREIQVLIAIAEGLTIKDIAEKYCISPRTVETHKNRLMDKLGIKNKSDIFKTAVRMGLIKNF